MNHRLFWVVPSFEHELLHAELEVLLDSLWMLGVDALPESLNCRTFLLAQSDDSVFNQCKVGSLRHGVRKRVY